MIWSSRQVVHENITNTHFGRKLKCPQILAPAGSLSQLLCKIPGIAFNFSKIYLLHERMGTSQNHHQNEEGRVEKQPQDSWRLPKAVGLGLYLSDPLRASGQSWLWGLNLRSTERALGLRSFLQLRQVCLETKRWVLFFRCSSVLFSNPPGMSLILLKLDWRVWRRPLDEYPGTRRFWIAKLEIGLISRGAVIF